MTIARKTVMISSTARDLPEHRKEVMDACLRQGMFPIMMEHLPANDDDAISASLKMVDEADIYIGIYAQRYGYIPKGKKRNPKQISVTEMEYNRAVDRKIPCLLFVMDKAHPITIDDIDMENAAKLQKFKDRVQAKNIVNFFKSPAELRAHVLNSLSKHLESSPVTIPDKESSVIDVTAYFNALRKRYNVLALEGLTPPQKEEYLQIQLSSVFVEQSVREDTPPVELPKEVWEKLSREQEIHDEDLPSGITLADVRKARDSYYQKPSRLVLDALTDARCQYTLILGDPGSGKSTLARYVMLSLIDPLLAGDKIQKAFESYLPLLIELRTFAGLCAEGKCETPLEFLEHLGKTEGWGLTQTALNNHLKNDGRAVVIFDGLDEIFQPKMREAITNQIVGFTTQYPKARVIVTSRILGYRRKILSDAGFTHFTLQDLDEKQVEAFITKWYQLAMSDRLDEAKERSERILKSFADSASIRQLAGNPMLLTIMAIIGKHQELPRERWKLYDHAASVLIQHWDVNKHLKDERIEADFIGEDDKKELLRRLAYRMQSGDGGLAGNYVHREGLQEEFESYLKERYSQTPDRAKVIADAMIQQFRERNFILSLYGANVFGFVHRAFLEYFCASAFVWKFEKTKELTIEQLKTDVYGKHWEDKSWHEVLRLICGMLDEKWADEIITNLANSVNSQTWPEQLAEHLPWNLSLSFQCLTEVRNLSALSVSLESVLKMLFNSLSNLEPNIEDRTRVFFEEEVLPAIEIIKDNWTQRNLLRMILVDYKIPDFTYIFYFTFLGQTIGLLGANLDDVFQIVIEYISNSSPWIRLVGVVALLNGWKNNAIAKSKVRYCATKDEYSYVREFSLRQLVLHSHDDPQTLPLLRERAVQDNDSNVRSAAVLALAEHYLEDAATLPLLRERAVQDNDPNVRSAAVLALAEHYLEDAATLPLLQERAVQDNDPNVRRAAVSALAKHYREDEETLPLLQERAVQDDDSVVRRAAVSAIITHYREDAATLPLLRERAVQDGDENVRSAAVSAIIEHYREDAETLPLLRERAVQDNDANVRSAAVSALAEHYREDTQTLPLLRERAVQDDDANVRSTAVSALAEYYREDAQTLPLLRERAVQDNDANVRSAAVSALAEHYREDTQTLPLLRERAVQDDDANVRSTAVSALAEYYREDAQTLPLLRERAAQDENENVRSASVSALAAFYREDAQTLLLLRERAVLELSPTADDENDKYYPREAAIEALAEHWSDLPDTLPLLRDRAENDPSPWLRERCKKLIEKVEGKKV